MNRFFTSLIDRHLDRCDTIQPRTPGLFEPDHGGIASPFTDETVNPPEGSPTQQREFSMNSTVEKIRYPEAGQNREELTSPSFPAQETPSIKHDFPETQQPSGFSLEPEADSLLNSDVAARFALPAQDQTTPPQTETANRPDTSHPENRDAQVDEPPINGPVQTGIRQNIGNEFGRHIQAAVERLTGEPEGQQKERPENFSAERKAPQQNNIVPPAEMVSVPEQNPDQQENAPATRRENSSSPTVLEPPPWLPEIEGRFKQFLQETKAEPEPVINVTIGRVEVRAVQPETPRQKPQPQKPAGVMTLDEYLKQREGGGPR